MDRSWRDVVAELAGADAEIGQGIAPEWDGMVVAKLAIPGAAFRIPGTTADEAWRRLAHSLGDLRLVQSFEAAGWVIVEEVIDETTYVVARAPEGQSGRLESPRCTATAVDTSKPTCDVMTVLSGSPSSNHLTPATR